MIAPQGLGDTLEATPMLAALRSARPDAWIEAIVLRPAARDLLARLPHLVDEVTYLPYWERGAFAFLVAAIRLPFRRQACAAYLTYPAARPVYLALAALVAARRRFGHRYERSAIRRVATAFVQQIPVRAAHNVLRNMDLLRAAEIEASAPDRYSVPEAWVGAGPRDPNRIVMHVGTIAHHGLEARRWPEAQFAELGRRLTARGFAVVLLAGPAERDATERVGRDVPGSRVMTLPLDETARFIASSAAVVANDSGIAHLAAGVGTPVIALFGPTPVEHGPYAPNAVAFRPSACPPCFDVVRTDSSCKLDLDYACLKADLPVTSVEMLLLAILGGGRTAPEIRAER